VFSKLTAVAITMNRYNTKMKRSKSF